jgi:pimeloyl-ACP methyl ester carboxylesterase
MSHATPETETIPVGDVELPADLGIPDDPRGLVVFAHGSGSSRESPRNRAVAETLRAHGLATLLFDLLTPEEDRFRENRFDIPLLTDRLVGVTEWANDDDRLRNLEMGYFGSSTGAAAALRAAARQPDRVRAVVSRGGRVDMADDVAGDVTAACRFIVGGADTQVLAWNRETLARLPGEADLVVVEGAGHLFEGPGQLEAVADHAADWFETHLGAE